MAVDIGHGDGARRAAVEADGIGLDLSIQREMGREAKADLAPALDRWALVLAGDFDGEGGNPMRGILGLPFGKDVAFLARRHAPAFLDLGQRDGSRRLSRRATHDAPAFSAGRRPRESM